MLRHRFENDGLSSSRLIDHFTGFDALNVSFGLVSGRVNPFTKIGTVFSFISLSGAIAPILRALNSNGFIYHCTGSIFWKVDPFTKIGTAFSFKSLSGATAPI